MKKITKFKNGAASFYVVAFSTLILVILAASFASAIVMEITRSSNEDLSQSAYDAALAGVEDAKIAFVNYQNCLAKGFSAVEPNGDDNVTCGEIIYWMQNPDCNMVGHILGRLGESAEGEVKIGETETADDVNNNMEQAYTCTIIRTGLNNYRADLGASNPYRAVKIKLDDNVDASSIKAVKLSWHSYKDEGVAFNYTNVEGNEESSRVVFKSLNEASGSVPPVLALQLVQTAKSFSISDLNSKTTSDGRTDRATMYLVPSSNSNLAKKDRDLVSNNNLTYYGTWDVSQNRNVLSKEQVASTNNHEKNYPYMVYCPEGASSMNNYACSVMIDLPEPINGSRSNKTFMFVVSLPYSQQDTDFSLELICADGVANCGEGFGGDYVGDNTARLSKMQVMIDSTGRANDLYRRVEIRLEPTDEAASYPLYAVEVDKDFEKNLMVTEEWADYSGYTNF